MLRLEREVLVTDPGTIAKLVADLDALTNGNLVRTIANCRHTNPVGPRLSRQLKRLVGANVRLPRR